MSQRRFAVVRARTRQEAEAYLPDKYMVLSEHAANPGGTLVNCVIAGYDNGGWTLDGYVIPRYGSGLLVCREYPNLNDAETAACAAMN